MIDIHCHILPGIDDGAECAAVACQMARRALDEGVDTIVATPHCNLPRCYPNHRGRRYTECISMFRALLRQEGIPLEILPGAEVFARRSNLRRLLEEDQLVTLNHSRYLLVEFPFEAAERDICDMLREIAHRGLVPVIAHPERYVALQTHGELAAQWYEQGYVLQVNKPSLEGRLGLSAMETAYDLLSLGLAHVIASDAHDMRYRTTGLRLLRRRLEPYCSDAYIDRLLEENPRRIISDQELK